MSRRGRLGRRGEGIARRHVLLRGATVAERNAVVQGVEIDLVLRHWTPPHWGVWVFAEVKTRRAGSDFALRAVDAAKQRRLVRGAEAWLLRRGLNPSETRLRFDVLA